MTLTEMKEREQNLPEPRPEELTENEKVEVLVRDIGNYLIESFFVEDTLSFYSNFGKSPEEGHTVEELELYKKIAAQLDQEKRGAYIVRAWDFYINKFILLGYSFVIDENDKDKQNKNLNDLRQIGKDFQDFLAEWSDKAYAVKMDLENLTYEIVDHQLDTDGIISQWNMLATEVFGEDAPELIREVK